MISTEEWFTMKQRYRKGVPISQIAREEGLDRKTVRKYVQCDRPPDRKPRARQPSILDLHKEYLKERLKDYPLSAVRLFEEIQERGYTGSYDLVKKYVGPLKRDRPIPAEVRFETPPGEQSQVDWIDFGRISLDGVIHHLYCFVMVLGFSRMRFIEYTFDVRQETFIKCHLNAFEYFGGYTRTILYDNMKQVVLHRALRGPDSTWNPLFKDFFEHYGFTPRLCRPGKSGAKTKGKVERTVQYVETGFHLGREFSSLADLNQQARAWLERANAKPHGTTHEVPLERLSAEHLLPMTGVRPFQVVLTEERKVSRDCFVHYRTNRYSVPWKFAGRTARLRIRESSLDVEVGNSIVCTHELLEGSQRCSRNKEHFAGLLSEVFRRNKENHVQRINSHRSQEADAPVMMTQRPDVDVQHRSLDVYDEFMIEEENE